MWNVHGIYFSESEFFNLGSTGILSAKADFGVFNGCQFQNIKDFGIQASGTTAFSIKGGDRGVTIIGEEPDTVFVAPVPLSARNLFRNCNYAIELLSTGHSKIYTSNVEENSLGISIKGETGYAVRGNSFSCNTVSLSIVSTGEFADQEGVNWILCNKYLKEDIAISVFGNNRGTEIDQEEFNATTADILMSGTSNPDTNPTDFTSIFSEQGNPDRPRANLFTDGGDKIVSPLGGAGTLLFDYFHLNLDSFPMRDPNFVAECDTMPNPAACASTKNKYANRPIDVDVDLCDSPIGGRPSSGRIINPGCSGFSCFQNYSNQLLNQLEEEETENTLEVQIQETDRLRAIRNYLRDSIVRALLAEDNYEQVKDLLSNSDFEEDLRVLLSIQLEMEKFNEAQSLMNDFEPEGTYTSDYFAIQNIYLSWLLSGSYSSGALNSLSLVINKNSKNSGYAIGIWGLLTGTPFIDETSGEGELPCFGGGGDGEPGNDEDGGRIQHQPTSFDLLLPVPNPTNEGFSLNFDSEITGNLFIINSLGQKVLEKGINSQKALYIGTGDWSKGIYYIHLKHKSGKVQSGKVLIQN